MKCMCDSTCWHPGQAGDIPPSEFGSFLWLSFCKLLTSIYLFNHWKFFSLCIHCLLINQLEGIMLPSVFITHAVDFGRAVEVMLYFIISV